MLGRDRFYQFALDPRCVERELVSRGFAVLERTWYEGFLGVADEAPPPLDRLMRRVYNDRRSRWCSATRRLAEPLCRRWAGYCHQIVARRGPEATAASARSAEVEHA
jgi:hypothetical protein